MLIWINFFTQLLWIINFISDRIACLWTWKIMAVGASRNSTLCVAHYLAWLAFLLFPLINSITTRTWVFPAWLRKFFADQSDYSAQINCVDNKNGYFSIFGPCQSGKNRIRELWIQLLQSFTNIYQRSTILIIYFGCRVESACITYVAFSL